MKNVVAVSLTAVLCLAMALPIYADLKTWDDLQEKALNHFQHKEFKLAVETQKKALAEAEKTFGPEDRNVAESLDNLSVYTQGLGDNAEADRLYQRALAILEKALPPDDPYLAIFMDYLSDFYAKVGKTDVAEKLRARSAAIRRKK